MDRPRKFYRRRILAITVFGVAFVAIALCGLWRTNLGQAFLRVYAPKLAARPMATVETFQPLPEFEFDIERKPVGWIAPGTCFSTDVPAGWTHLLLENDMKVVAGASEERAASWNELLSAFSLVVLVRLTQQHDRHGLYYLDEVAMGWCHDTDTGSMVISSTTYREFGVKLRTLEAMLLAMQELDCEQSVRVVARSAVTMIYDVERYFVFNDEHGRAILRHAVMVHPRTGELATFQWLVAPNSDLALYPPTIQLLPDGFVTTYELRLKPSLGQGLRLPAADDFAILRLPAGKKQLPIDANLGEVALARNFTPQHARELEQRLRHYLGWK